MTGSEFAASLRRLTWDILKGAAHPASIVSLLGPLFLTINLNWLFRLTGDGSDTAAPVVELGRILHDPWAFTLADYLIQSYTLVLAVALFAVSFAAGLLACHRKHGQDFIRGDGFTLSLVFVVALATIGGLLAVTNGVFGSPKVVSLYQPAGAQFWGVTRCPPLDSPLTWARGATFVLGIMLSVWLKKRA